jgi:hypothetical protein
MWSAWLDMGQRQRKFVLLFYLNRGSRTKTVQVRFGDPNDDLTWIDHTRLEALRLTATLVKYYYLDL